MNKLILFLLFCNVTTAQSISQLELLSTISDDICQEISKKNIRIENEMVLGLFMLRAINKHIDDVEFYYGNDYVGSENVILKISEELGYHLGLKCPEIFENLYSENLNQIETGFLKVSGKFVKSYKNQFLTFVIKEDSGKKHEFLLLNTFENYFLLTDKLLKENDIIEVTYYVSELYDPKIGKFVNYNIVSAIEKK